MPMETTLLVVTAVSVVVALGAGWLALRLWREERLRSDVRVALLTELSQPPATPAGPGIGELFQTEAPGPSWAKRLAIAAGLFAAVALGIAAYGALMNRVAPSTPSVAAAPRPLELVSLSHANEGNVLLVTGRVQNPRQGVVHSRVVAATVLLDAAGAVIADGRAPLDVARLEPGDESPFVIRIPTPGAVARYRISFRGGDDRPLAHVDRRDPALARKEAP
jgi:hypothetical protein